MPHPLVRDATALVREAARSWWRHNPFTQGSALAFFAVLSLSPLLLVVVRLVGLLFGTGEARTAVVSQLGDYVGPAGAEALADLVRRGAELGHGPLTAALAIGTLLFGATSVFVQLQWTLNLIWEVSTPPGGVWGFVKTRLLSLAMIVGLGMLIAASLLLGGAVAAADSLFDRWLPGWVPALKLGNAVLSLGLAFGLFALVYKLLPAVPLAWSDVWVGAAVTAVLFLAGDVLLGVYLGRVAAQSAYGAAGSFVILLLWIYYSSMILFFGAELTRTYAARHGSGRTSALGEKSRE